MKAHKILSLVYTMRLRLRGTFNIVVNGLTQERDGKDQRKTQMQTCTVTEALVFSSLLHNSQCHPEFDKLVDENTCISTNITIYMCLDLGLRGEEELNN